VVSDTHSEHRNLTVPPGDVLIHCGDFVKSRTKINLEEYKDFANWFSSLPHETKILIAGNRDDFMDTGVIKDVQKRPTEEIEEIQHLIKENKDFVYLEDESFRYLQNGIELKIWGSPWTTEYGKGRKAFQVPETELVEKWKPIPEDIDILVTHGPPYGICDKNLKRESTGSPSLREKVLQLKPRLHLFGHIHEAYGKREEEGILFINAASMDRITKKVTNAPVVLDMFSDAKLPVIVEN